MPQRRKHTLEIRQILLHLRAGQSERSVCEQTGLARNTLRRYRNWAKEHHLLSVEPLPATEQLHQLLEQSLPAVKPPQNLSTVEPFAETVTTLREQGVEIRAIHQRLTERGFTGSYSAVYRFVQRLQPKTPETCLRVETPPGYEAQVDFGEVGKLVDPHTGKLRKAYVFVMTLSFSRHLYAELVFDQKAPTWLAAHTRALDYFGGVPARLVIDNLKAGILQAAWEDPQVNRAYAELAEHYGFLIAPCRPATPQHKGKVESGVHYVQRNFMAGRDPSDLPAANRALRAWCEMVGQRVHGTTRKKPQEQFDRLEKAVLQALPPTPYDPGVYKQVKLHRDGYVVFEGAYYSAPFRLVGQTLWVRAGLTQVRLLTQEYQIVATHDRAKEAGERHTHPDHLPAERAAALPRTPRVLREQAHQIGPHTLAVVEEILSDPVVDKTGSASRLLRLADKYSPARLESACERALHFAEARYTTVRDILARGLETPPSLPPQAPPATTFARTARELFAQFKGALSWM